MFWSLRHLWVRSAQLPAPHIEKLSVRSATVIQRDPSLSYFSRIKNTEIDQELEDLSELTVFLPVDPAWESLHPIERLYLESEFATDDLLKILNWHAVEQRNVIWSESFDPGVNRRFFRHFPTLIRYSLRIQSRRSRETTSRSSQLLRRSSSTMRS